MAMFSFKLPDPLFVKLEGTSASRHETKGALVRAALEAYLSTEERGEKREEDINERLQRATRHLTQGKGTSNRMNWKNIYREAKAGAGALSPEKEVETFRRRGL